MVYPRLFFSTVAALTFLCGCSKLGDYAPPDALVVTATPVPSPSVTVTVPNPIHEWEFENNGTDSGSSANWTGTLNAPATYSGTAGEFKIGSYAAKFPAGGSFSLGVQTFPSAFTVSCWVRWLTGGASAGIIANSATGVSSDGFRLYVQPTGLITLETGTGATGIGMNSVSNLTSGTYEHVVGVFDGVLDESAIYINGVLDKSGTVQPGFNLGTAVYLGSLSGSNPFDGELDDCRVYDVALSSAQVAILYNGY